MNAQHTPGPWATKPQGDANFYFTTYQHPRRGNKDWLMSIQFNGELSVIEQEANVRIIDAATNLLMALELVMPALDSFREKYPRNKHDDSIDVVEFARNAIAMARGQA